METISQKLAILSMKNIFGLFFLALWSMKNLKEPFMMAQ